MFKITCKYSKRFLIMFIFIIWACRRIPTAQSNPPAVGVRLQVRSAHPCDCMVVKGAHRFALLLPASHRMFALRAFPASTSRDKTCGFE